MQMGNRYPAAGKCYGDQLDCNPKPSCNSIRKERMKFTRGFYTRIASCISTYGNSYSINSFFEKDLAFPIRIFTI